MQAGDAIHTYRLRQGRTSRTALAELERLQPRFGCAPTDLLDPLRVFGRLAPLVVEIGSGMGEATAAMAAADPEIDIIAVEVHRAGVAALLQRLDAAQLTNVRVVEGDAVALLGDVVALSSLTEVRVFFPDPWPKARHAKRRLLSPAFARLVAGRLVPGGRLHVATDWPAYAEQAARVMTPVLDTQRVERPPTRPVTRFEQRGLAAGRASYDVVGVRRDPGRARLQAQTSPPS